MGAINVKHTGSGADIALSSDGTSLLLDGTAIGGGGGGADLYADNYTTGTQPTATGANGVALGLTGIASGVRAVAIRGTASGTDSVALGGIAAGNKSISGPNESTIASGCTGAVALGTNEANAGATIAGNGYGAVALGAAYASGANSFSAVITNNTSTYGATGANSVAIGYLAKSTATGSQALGYNSVASGGYSTAIGGYAAATASGTNSLAIGTSADASTTYAYAIGPFSIASAVSSFAIGNSAKSDIRGKFAYANGTSNHQGGYFILRSDTTDATAEALTTDNAAASTDNQVILPNNSAFSFSGTIIARQQAADGSNYASWEIKGALLRDANAASTVLGNGIVNKLFATAGASAWAIALTADTTNGGLKIEATGAAATDIRWVATVNTSEVTYA
jgi:hypothetical protein